MKIVNNAGKYNLPPRYALLRSNGTLYVYASKKGLAIGIKAAVNNSTKIHALTVFEFTGCAWIVTKSMDYCGSSYSVPDYAVSEFVDVLHVLCKLSCAYKDAETPAETPAEIPAYQRRVSCAGSPATVAACVVFVSGGRTFVRGYQSYIRAWQGYYHYTSRAFSSACILYRFSDGWTAMDSVFCRPSPVPYTEIRAFEDLALWHSVKHFGKGGCE